MSAPSPSPSSAPAPSRRPLASPPADGSGETIHLLFRDDPNVQWARERGTLELALSRAALAGARPACPNIVELRLPPEHSRALAELSCPLDAVPMRAESPASRMPLGEVEKARAKLARAGARGRGGDGHRVYVIFDARGRCFWSPSGNNLASIAERAPAGHYLGAPLRVEMPVESLAWLDAYFDWMADNF